MKKIILIALISLFSCAENEVFIEIQVNITGVVLNDKDSSKCRYSIEAVLPYQAPSKNYIDVACGTYYVGQIVTVRL